MTKTIDLGAITERQREIWRWVRDHHARERVGCGVRDVCKAFGFESTNAAMCHLRPLRRRGWIEWRSNKANTIIPTLESLEVCDE